MIQFITSGGPIMWILLAGMFIALTVFIERYFHLHRAQINVEDFLEGVFNILRKNNFNEAISICQETPGPIAHIAKNAIIAKNRGEQDLERVIKQASLAEIPRLEGPILILSTVGYIAPLLGFLGTIIGLIQSLINIQTKAPLVSAADFVVGLWPALITTAAGLIVAIIAFIFYNLIIHNIESILMDMERSSFEIMNFLNNELAVYSEKDHEYLQN